MFSDHLLYARHCSYLWKYSCEHDRHGLCSHVTYIVVEEKRSQQEANKQEKLSDGCYGDITGYFIQETRKDLPPK